MKMRIIPSGFYYELQFKDSLLSGWKTLYDDCLPCRMTREELNKAIDYYRLKGYRLV